MPHPDPLLIRTPTRHPFARVSSATATVTGHPLTFFIACSLIVVLAITGPIFDFSNTWQLMINTSTTIATFLMVFLIQNTQNRESMAMQLKLDELIRSDKDAHYALLDLEELTEAELFQLRKKYEALAEKSREALRRGQSDTKVMEL